jgi:hypothetical protein
MLHVLVDLTADMIEHGFQHAPTRGIESEQHKVFEENPLVITDVKAR